MFSLRKSSGGYQQALWEKLEAAEDPAVYTGLALDWENPAAHHIVYLQSVLGGILSSQLLSWSEALYHVTPSLETSALSSNLFGLCLRGTTGKWTGEPTSAILPHQLESA